MGQAFKEEYTFSVLTLVLIHVHAKSLRRRASIHHLKRKGSLLFLFDDQIQVLKSTAFVKLAKNLHLFLGIDLVESVR